MNSSPPCVVLRVTFRGEVSGLIRDEELCRQVQEGSEAALEALVHRYHRPIFAYLYRLTMHQQTAEDLTQETFTRLLAQIHTYRFPRPFRPWIYTIAHNLYRDHVKAAARRAFPAADPDRVRPSPVVDLSEQIAEQAALSQALRALDEGERAVLLLRFYHGLSSPEVAEVVGIPPGTVRSRLSRAVRKLRDLLEPTAAQDGRSEMR